MPQILKAAVTASYVWWCSLTAPMEGDARHFLLYGRDAWEGEAIMRCQGAGEEFNQMMTVSFFSKNPGFGANSASSLRLSLTLWTSTSPRGFTFTATAPAMADGSMMHWQISDAATELTASVWTGSLPGVAQSLSLGTLSIKPSSIAKIP